MQNIDLICVGKLNAPYFAAGVAEYQKRLGAFCNFRIIELPEAAIASDSSDSDVATDSNAEADHSTAGAATSTVSTDSASGYQYYDAQGKRASGWMTIEGIPGVSAEDETYQFYFKNGVPYFAKTGIQTFSINTARYLSLIHI